MFRSLTVLNSRKMWTAVFICVSCISSVNADVILTFDTAAETYKFEGSAEVVPDSFPPSMFGPPSFVARWESEYMPSGNGLFTGTILGLSGLNITPDGNLFPEPVLIRFAEIDNDESQISGALFIAERTTFTNPNGNVFFTGDGVEYSYAAGLTSFEKDFLAEANFPDGNLVNGTSSDTFSIQFAASAVPEPSSLSLLLVGAVGFIGRRRRRKETTI